jgi:hypothetical protein
VQNRAALQPWNGREIKKSAFQFQVIESGPLFDEVGLPRMRVVCRPVLIVTMDESLGEFVVKWSAERTAGESPPCAAVPSEAV